ncbi:MAG: hypothetical protein FJ009_19525 [Chloroflexi bacterium]|nr:hypothetical protein [Chloroflexota bacterium]
MIVRLNLEPAPEGETIAASEDLQASADAIIALYALLDASARAWWYHRQLRENGQIAEARRRELASIRDHARDLRQAQVNAGFVTVGRGGWTLHIACGHTLKGYGDVNDTIPQCALRLGLPIVDSTTIADEKINLTLRLPFPQIGAKPRTDKTRDSSFDPAPIEDVARLYRDLGATVYNLARG